MMNLRTFFETTEAMDVCVDINRNECIELHKLVMIMKDGTRQVSTKSIENDYWLNKYGDMNIKVKCENGKYANVGIIK